MTFLSKKTITFAFALIILSVFSMQASANDMGEGNIGEILESSDTMDIPVTVDNSHQALAGSYPIMRMTQDKSELVKLTNEAASVVVGNPNHINVLLDTPDTLIVVPRAAGASHFTVMGKDGNIVMQRHVIVGAAKEKYVRIRRSCNAANAGSANCQAISTYFCPDSCHEVQENTGSTRR